MIVRVLFFGATADLVGQRNIVLDLIVGSTVSDAVASICKANPKIENHNLLFALNQRYVSGGEIIENGDEFAIFTAVSGG